MPLVLALAGGGVLDVGFPSGDALLERVFGEATLTEDVGGGIGRRGGARPIASCIDATRRRVTSVPH